MAQSTLNIELGLWSALSNLMTECIGALFCFGRSKPGASGFGISFVEALGVADRTFLANGRVAWNTVPKHHYFCHVGLRSEDLNPKWTQTYTNESVVGRICSIYKSCLNGQHDKVVQKSVLSKWFVGLQVDLAQHQRR